MKKLSKVLSVVMAIAMMFTMTYSASAESYTDVKTSDTYYEAVEGLSALGVVKGYEEGDFQPDGKITRAETAAIIMRVMGMGAAESNRTDTEFSDVKSDHWASGVVAEAAGAGIVNGMGDGTFAPSSEVTYEQVVKMLVCAMGYERKAAASVTAGTNPFPTGYNLIANQKKITDGTTKSEGGATRATVARLVYNALTVNLMDQTSFGTDEKYEECKDQSLLFTKLSAIKVETKIDSVPLDPTDNKITLNVTDYDDVAAYTTNGYGSTKRISSVKKGDVNLAGLQGLSVNALIDISESSDPVLLAVFPKAGKNEELVVDPQLFAGIDGTKITYYKDADSSTKNTSSKIEAPFSIYMNLDAISTETTEATAAAAINAFKLSDTDKIITNNQSYRFVDTDNNGYYDTLFVDNSASFVVGKVIADDFEIYKDTASSIFNSKTTLHGSYEYEFSPLDLDKSDDDVDYSISDAEGNALTFEDVKVGDILTVAESTDGACKYYDITVSTASSVEGTISEITTEKVKDSTNNKYITYYVIDGNKYRVNGADSDSKLEAGTAGTFKITAEGAIISYELEASARSYGIVIKVASNNDSFTNGVQAQMMTTDGTIKTFDFASKATVFKTAALSETATDTTVAGVATTFSTAMPAGTVVIYETNSANEIKKIYVTEAAIKAKDEDVELTTLDGTKDYSVSTGKVNGRYIVEDTKVIGVKSASKVNDKDSYSFGSMDSLSDGELYTGTLVCDSSSKEVSLAFITNLAVKPEADSIPMVITSVSTTSVDGATRDKVTGFVENKEVSYVIADEDDITFYGVKNSDTEGTYATPVANEVIQFVVNANDEIISIKKLVECVSGKFYALTVKDVDVDTDDETRKGYYTNLTTGVADTGTEYDMKGYAVAGKTNKVSSKNVEFFKSTAFTTVADLTADSNIFSASYNGNTIAYFYGPSYSKVKTGSLDTVKSFDSVKTGNDSDIANKLNVTSSTEKSTCEDVVYTYTYDGANVLNFVYDPLSNTKN